MFSTIHFVLCSIVTLPVHVLFNDPNYESEFDPHLAEKIVCKDDRFVLCQCRNLSIIFRYLEILMEIPINVNQQFCCHSAGLCCLGSVTLLRVGRASDTLGHY